MKNFQRAAKLKEFYSEQPYSHCPVLTINVLHRVLPIPLSSHLVIVVFYVSPSVLQHADHYVEVTICFTGFFF